MTLDSCQKSQGLRANRLGRLAPTDASRRGPLVSLLLPTYNRRRYLPEALASALRQTHRDLEVFVVNDGGEDVSDIVRSFDDPRLIFIDRAENRGKPHSLNEMLHRAQGKYVAYLDDDDILYPHHVETLVRTLENETDCQAAYSDLYRTYCNVLSDGRRQVLSKQVEVCRDFDRFMMFYFNHVLHVSLMHRRELLAKTGPYNENLNILIDWDMTRRLAFFTDLQHVPTITGEFYSPLGECDRISVQRRKCPEEYLKNVLAIRTTRPPKPWSKAPDVAIIVLEGQWDRSLADLLGRMWRYTFYPYRVFVPLAAQAIPSADVGMPNITFVPVDPQSSEDERVDVALGACDAEYVAIVPRDLPIKDMWLENPLYALINTPEPFEGFLLEEATPEVRGIVVKRTDLQQARRAHPHLSVEASLTACRVRIRQPRGDELPFAFDGLVQQAKLAEADGNWALAGRAFEHAAATFHNELWMNAMAARAYFEAGDTLRAGQLSRTVNQVRPTIDTLLMEAKIKRQEQDIPGAIRLLSQAEQWLAGAVDSPAHAAGCGALS